MMQYTITSITRQGRGALITHVDQVWRSDITYVRLEYGWLYLVAILDRYRYALGSEVSNTFDGEFCVATLDRALAPGRALDNVCFERLWRTCRSRRSTRKCRPRSWWRPASCATTSASTTMSVCTRRRVPAPVRSIMID